MAYPEKIQSLLDRQIGRGNVHNVIVGMQSEDSSVDFVGAAGIADPASGAPMAPDTPYSLASITKMYTAAVILRLHDQGLLDLDEAISKYLPASLIEGIHVYKGTDYSDQLKVYHLVSQTSGLADYFLDRPRGGRSVFEELKAGHDMALDNERVMEVVRVLEPKFAPGANGGTKARYADTNYRLLGEIVESVTGESVVKVFARLIFEPLGLADTHFYDPGAACKPATIYLGKEPVDLPLFFSSNTTDGGIISTARDNLTFLRGFFEGRLFDPAWFGRMTARWNSIFFPMQYGYGMMRVNLPRVFSPFKPFPEYVGHSGSTGSFAYRCAEKSLYLVGTVNQIADPSRPIRLMMQIGSMLKG
jgi:D-alanyl-D-alanine carboxypeptidase